MPADRVTSKTPWHWLLILDLSNEALSMGGVQAVDALIEEMKLISQGLKSYFRLSIIRPGSRPRVLTKAIGEREIDQGLVERQLRSPQSTDVAAALQEARDILLQNGGAPTDFTPYVFFLSDGAPDSVPDALAAASALKSMTVPAGTPKVVTIGFGPADDEFLRQLASTPEMYRRITDYRDLFTFLPPIGTLAAEGNGDPIMNL